MLRAVIFFDTRIGFTLGCRFLVDSPAAFAFVAFMVLSVAATSSVLIASEVMSASLASHGGMEGGVVAVQLAVDDSEKGRVGVL